MEYKKLTDINKYKSESVNPAKMPDILFELYSVPMYEKGHPEYLRGDEIASNKAVVKKNDILLCKINPRINRVWVVKDESEHPNIASTEWIVIRNESYNPDFLAWYFRTPKFQKLMTSEVTGIGGSLTRAQPKYVAEYPVPVLNRNQQDAIVNVLNKCRFIIVSRRQELANLDELIKSRFVEMFGSPITNDKNLPIASLGSCLQDIENGRSFVCDRNSRTGNQPGLLKLSAATYGFYKPEENKAILSEDDFVEQSEVRDGDLLFTRKNTPELVGMSAYVWQTPKKLMMPDLIFRLIPNQKIHPIFLWKLINHDVFRCKIQELATGTAKSMSNISKERLRNLEIIVPPIKLQNQFADFVAQVDKSKVAVQKALDETQMLFDSLMQKYFG